MSDYNKNNEIPGNETCDCHDPNCCQPKPRKSWQKFVFMAVVLVAVGIIAFKVLYTTPKKAECNSKGCCSDTTQCSGKSQTDSANQTHDLTQ